MADAVKYNSTLTTLGMSCKCADDIPCPLCMFIDVVSLVDAIPVIRLPFCIPANNIGDDGATALAKGLTDDFTLADLRVGCECALSYC